MVINDVANNAYSYLRRNGYANLKQRPQTEILTQKELKTIELIACGYSAKEIGLKHKLSEQTIKNLASNIYKKLHVTNAPSAVTKAIKLGLLDLDKITIKD